MIENGIGDLDFGRGAYERDEIYVMIKWVRGFGFSGSGSLIS